MPRCLLREDTAPPEVVQNNRRTVWDNENISINNTFLDNVLEIGLHRKEDRIQLVDRQRALLFAWEVDEPPSHSARPSGSQQPSPMASLLVWPRYTLLRHLTTSQQTRPPAGAPSASLETKQVQTRKTNERIFGTMPAPTTAEAMPAVRSPSP